MYERYALHMSNITLRHLFNDAMELLGPFEPQPHLALSVSGGPDSRALALLSVQWAQAHRARVTALVVDHSLRPESRQEAVDTRHWLQSLPVACEVLHVEVATQGNLQTNARNARYDALTAWCKTHGVLHLLLGHHLDDQQETFLQRLARGSGVEGLSSMATCAYREDVRLLRPLLGITKAQLVDFLTENNVPWITDASNASEAYQRNRLRRATPLLEAEGLTPERVMATRQRLGRTASYIQQQQAIFLARYAGLSIAGYGWIETGAWCAAHPEVADRALRAVLTSVRGRDTVPRFEEVARLADAMRADDFRGATLHGCRVISHLSSACFYILREAEAAQIDLRSQPQRWDARFDVSGPTYYRLRCLASDGLKQLRTEGFSVPERFPVALLHRLPSLWQLERCVAVPHIQYGAALGDTGICLRFAPRKPLC